MALGCFMQGGFYDSGRAGVLALILCAAVLTDWRGTPNPTDRRLMVLAGLLIAWVGCSAMLRGSWRDAVPAAGTVLAFTLMFLVARRFSRDEARVAVVGVTTVGLVVAVAGMVGVAMHRGPWAAPEASLWRSLAATTYWNATAAILVMLAMVALAQCARVGVGPAPAVAAAVLLAGAAATLSRGGALAAGAGILSLGLLGGFAALRAAVPPVVGACLILLGLVPSFPISAAPNPGLALLGAALGVTATILLGRWMPAVSPPLALVVVVAGLAVLGALVIPPLAARLTLASPRWGGWRSALGSIAEHPLVGVGPGKLFMVWQDAAGVSHGTSLVHNEWLQVLAEIGAIGFCLVLALAVVVMIPVGRGLVGEDKFAARAGIAAAAAFAVASALDFLWHLITVPVLLALILGCTASRGPQGSRQSGPSTDLIPVPKHD